MSQTLVLELLEELGGSARWRDLFKLAKAKYPELALHTNIGKRLTALAASGEIIKSATGYWEVNPNAPPMQVGLIVKKNGRFAGVKYVNFASGVDELPAPAMMVKC